MTGRRVAAAAWVVLATLLLGACAYTDDVNPDTAMTRDEARLDLRRMRDDPQPLQRPVVVLNGYRGPGWLLLPFVQDMSALTNRDRSQWHGVNYTETTAIEHAAEVAVNAVERRWPSDDPDKTIELDVIGLSMGGLVAREAAIEPALRGRTGKRLNVRRLFTVGTPHRGARMAVRIAPDRAAKQMIPGSQYLADLDTFLPDAGYEMLCYGQTNDRWVGLENMAPNGAGVIWAEGRVFFGHFVMTDNPILLSDLARRLRGEPPIARPTRAPTECDSTGDEPDAADRAPAGGAT